MSTRDSLKKEMITCAVRVFNFAADGVRVASLAEELRQLAEKVKGCGGLELDQVIATAVERAFELNARYGYGLVCLRAASLACLDNLEEAFYHFSLIKCSGSSGLMFEWTNCNHDAGLGLFIRALLMRSELLTGLARQFIGNLSHNLSVGLSGSKTVDKLSFPDRRPPEHWIIIRLLARALTHTMFGKVNLALPLNDQAIQLAESLPDTEDFLTGQVFFEKLENMKKGAKAPAHDLLAVAIPAYDRASKKLQRLAMGLVENPSIENVQRLANQVSVAKNLSLSFTGIDDERAECGIRETLQWIQPLDPICPGLVDELLKQHAFCLYNIQKFSSSISIYRKLLDRKRRSGAPEFVLIALQKELNESMTAMKLLGQATSNGGASDNGLSDPSALDIWQQARKEHGPSHVTTVEACFSYALEEYSALENLKKGKIKRIKALVKVIEKELMPFLALLGDNDRDDRYMLVTMWLYALFRNELDAPERAVDVLLAELLREKVEPLTNSAEPRSGGMPNRLHQIGGPIIDLACEYYGVGISSKPVTFGTKPLSLDRALHILNHLWLDAQRLMDVKLLAKYSIRAIALLGELGIVIENDQAIITRELAKFSEGPVYS